jgi:hypothetical protein
VAQRSTIPLKIENDGAVGSRRNMPGDHETTRRLFCSPAGQRFWGF